MTDELVAWLREQLDEDERMTRDATPGAWTVDAVNNCSVLTDDSTTDNRGHVIYSVGMYTRGWPSTADAEHIARWAPARALREIEATRRIVDSFAAGMEFEPLQRGTERYAIVRMVLKLLALPYADRPGYRDAVASVTRSSGVLDT